MKIIAVTQRIDQIPERDEQRDALDQRVCRWLQECGLLPVPVPNVLGPQEVTRWVDWVRPHGILLSGGNDIGQSPLRDALEHSLLQWAERASMPVLGICRGMQMMGVYGGVELVETRGHIGSSHAVDGEITAEVNSYHRYTLSACPKDYRVLARSSDGNIEAMVHKILPWEGWMWHPERDETFSAEWLMRAGKLFEVRGDA